MGFLSTQFFFFFFFPHRIKIKRKTKNQNKKIEDQARVRDSFRKKERQAKKKRWLRQENLPVIFAETVSKEVSSSKGISENIQEKNPSNALLKAVASLALALITYYNILDATERPKAIFATRIKSQTLQLTTLQTHSEYNQIWIILLTRIIMKKKEDSKQK